MKILDPHLVRVAGRDKTKNVSIVVKWQMQALHIWFHEMETTQTRAPFHRQVAVKATLIEWQASMTT